MKYLIIDQNANTIVEVKFEFNYIVVLSTCCIILVVTNIEEIVNTLANAKITPIK